MNTFLTAIIPVFVVIAIGFGLRFYHFPGDAFWNLAARLTYVVFFPSLLINRLAHAELGNIDVFTLALALTTPIMIVTVVLISIKSYIPLTNPAYTSLYQGSIRFNTYIGLACVAAVAPNKGVALAAIALAILIPFINVLSISFLTFYLADQGVSIKRIIRSIVRNPLIIACMIGIGLNLTGIGLPFITGDILTILSDAALPIGLLTVGAGLDLQSVKTSTMPVVLATAIKLLVMPLLAIAMCSLLQLSGLVATVVILFCALPGAPSAYILAQELGGDTTLMASIVTVQTALALLTMPLVALFW
ncbi:MAG: AEC family transporter [Chloroflexaceae bacterium]|nr:AEC family transporter [Chloroflexaceae bacterium]